MHAIIPDPHPPADKRPGPAMELNARIVAAGAVAADFHAAAAAFQDGGPRPDYATWALRLEQHLNYVLGALNDREHGQDDDGLDGLEPYCAECGAWIGMFLGMEGWHHFRGQGTAADPVELYDARHEAAIAWCRPPGRSLSPADAAVLAEALADAVAYVEDLNQDQADAYAELGRQLAQEDDQ